jgi:hypothetical protein
MGMTPLALVGGTPHDTDRCSNWLEARLAEISPLLVDNPVWSNAVMNEVFGHLWLNQTYAVLPFSAAVPVLTNEIKAYLAASVLDDRNADAQWFQRRIPVIRYLVGEGADLLRHFEAGCLADIPHPSFAPSDDKGRANWTATMMQYWSVTLPGMARIMDAGCKARPVSESAFALIRGCIRSWRRFRPLSPPS